MVNDRLNGRHVFTRWEVGAEADLRTLEQNRCRGAGPGSGVAASVGHPCVGLVFGLFGFVLSLVGYCVLVNSNQLIYWAAQTSSNIRTSCGSFPASHPVCEVEGVGKFTAAKVQQAARLIATALVSNKLAADGVGGRGRRRH